MREAQKTPSLERERGFVSSSRLRDRRMVDMQARKISRLGAEEDRG